ncbi:hypothetical protein HNQ36_000372 [Afipia massiliensis]|uniref:DUF6538 domain-containing protein n=1 Tax=Afipia massiliensis TaxID=211460 RepID=A0A840MVF4_9BRAD|nr:DUF6538 domain-containing protein [Afipia massiliensis]MBB5050424.1 hypothetical protein [Afipia massiliensis]
MPLLHNLRQKNGIFFFRRKVPAALQALLKKREIVRSLGRCDPRTARFRASQLWIVTERMFQMFVKFKLEEGDEPDLINPDQLKLFVDAMLTLNRYNDEYVIARLLLNYEVWAKRARADRLKNNISGVVEEIQDLAEQLDMPIRQGSSCFPAGNRTGSIGGGEDELAREEDGAQDLESPPVNAVGILEMGQAECAHLSNGSKPV